MVPFPPIYFLLSIEKEYVLEPIQEVIEIPSFIDLIDFLGPKDSFLNVVKNRCDVKITLNFFLDIYMCVYIANIYV